MGKPNALRICAIGPCYADSDTKSAHGINPGTHTQNTEKEKLQKKKTHKDKGIKKSAAKNDIVQTN